MRILQVCNRIPYPLIDGSSICIFNMTKAYHQLDVDLSMLAMNPRRQQSPDEAPEQLRRFTDLHTYPVDNRIRAGAAFMNLFSSKSYNVQRFESEGFESKLIELLQAQSYDVIQLEGLYVCLYLETIRSYSKAKVILRAHNVEHRIWERMASGAVFPKRGYLKLLAKRLKAFEAAQLNKVDALVPITETDAQSFKKMGCRVPIHVSPAGMDLASYIPEEKEVDLTSLFHIGSMQWLPNLEGVRWFLSEVWPRVRNRCPDLKFYLAGRSIPKWMHRLSMDGVEVVDEVPDAIAFMKSKDILVVPLLSGSGMRIKILEAMALQKPVVSTTLGADGIPTENGTVTIADTPEELVRGIAELVEDPQLALTRGRQGRALVERHFENESLVRGLMGFFDKEL